MLKLAALGIIFGPLTFKFEFGNAIFVFIINNILHNITSSIILLYILILLHITCKTTYNLYMKRKNYYI